VIIVKLSANSSKRGSFLLYSFLVMLAVGASLVCAAATQRDTRQKPVWRAPAAEMAKKNPVTASQESIKSGEKIYNIASAPINGLLLSS
jgi:hypothetical protein